MEMFNWWAAAMPQPLLLENSQVYSSISLTQDAEEGCNCCDFL